jgi:hypothetical protein
MSKVYSFRLDENNPREAQAREVIDAWVSKGYSLRHIIVDALNIYNKKKISSDEGGVLLKKLESLLVQYAKSESQEDVGIHTMVQLSPHFVEGISNSVKSGIKNVV